MAVKASKASSSLLSMQVPTRRFCSTKQASSIVSLSASYQRCSKAIVVTDPNASKKRTLTSTTTPRIRLHDSLFPPNYRLSSTNSNAPLIHATDIPAPNTGRIRVLALNRPAARNAISKQLLHELRSHVDAIAAEYGKDGVQLPLKKVYGGVAGADNTGPTRALIISSAVDSCFCSGADLKERATFTPDEYVLSS